jgi:hypothetical protein
MPCSAEAVRGNDGTEKAWKEQSAEVQDGWNSASGQLAGNRTFKVDGSGTRREHSLESASHQAAGRLVFPALLLGLEPLPARTLEVSLIRRLYPT